MDMPLRQFATSVLREIWDCELLAVRHLVLY